MTTSNRFAHINRYFDKIYVINLSRAEQRRDSIAKHFEGLNYVFWVATDRLQLDQSVLQDAQKYDDLAHKRIKRTHRSMTLGEYACAHSHLSIYADAVKHNFQRILIFEDDAVPVLDRLSNFDKQLSSLPDDWDCVLFDYYDAHFSSALTALKQAMYKVFHFLNISNWQNVPLDLINNMSMRHYNDDFYIPGRFSGSHAYALSLKAARAFAEYQTPIKLQADRIFYYYLQNTDLKQFAAKRPMFTRGELAQTSFIGLSHSKPAQ